MSQSKPTSKSHLLPPIKGATSYHNPKKHTKHSPKRFVAHAIGSPLLQKAFSLLSNTVVADEKSSDLASRLSPLTDNILTIKSMARGMFNGDRTYKFYLAIFGGLFNTSTTGVLYQSTNFTTDMQAASNWSALASIFDEFTFLAVKIELVPSSPGFNTSSPAPTILAFDDDGNPPYSGSYNAVAAYPTSRLICPAVQGSTLGTEANSTGLHPYTTTHRRPYDSSTGPSVNAPTTGWVDMGTPNNLLGSWITYNNSGNTTNNVQLYSYLAQYEAAFRFVR
jgi:hypothetical protein